MKKKSDQKTGKLILAILSIFIPVLACSFPTPSSISDSQPTSTESLGVGDNQDSGNQTISTELPIEIESSQPNPGSILQWVDTSLLVYIPPGEFIMGHNDIDDLEDENEDHPEHLVYLAGFWIYRTEVTNRMYLQCMAKGQCSPPAVDPAIPEIEDPEIADLPVVGIRWDQAVDYCRSVGGSLPTEAQWEKTARGPEGDLFPWGDTEPNCDLLNFNNCREEISSVLSYPKGASHLEVLDMAGNVFEWVADWYQESYYQNSSYENPLGPDHGEVRSVRSSTFRSPPDRIESYWRYYLEPDEYRSDLGFRCVVGNAQEYAPLCEVFADNFPEGIADNPNEAPGGSAACVVPEPDLSVVTYCDEGQRGNNISWTPPDAEFEFSTLEEVYCMLYDVDTLSCQGEYGASVFVEVCKSCPPPVVQLGTIAVCDDPYVLDDVSNLCVYDGPPVPDRVICAPGYSLSGDSSCCDLVEGTPLDFPICPIGGVFDPTSLICWFTLPSTGDEKCASTSVFFNKCEQPGDGGQSDKPTDEPTDPCTAYTTYNDCHAHENEGCHWNRVTNTCSGE